MRDKGYDFPLHSLDLLRPGEAPDDPLHVLSMPAGRLVVRRALRERAERTSTAALSRAMYRALGGHGLVAPLLDPYGLGAEWSASMRKWWGVLREQEEARAALEVRAALCLRDQQERVAAARQLWGRLALCARLCGLHGLITVGRAPRGEAEFLAALEAAARRAQEPARAAALGESGFSAGNQAELALLVSAIGPGRLALQLAQGDLREAGASIVVLRAALLGDLSLLATVTAQVLGPDQASGFQRQVLLPRPGGGGVPGP